MLVRNYRETCTCSRASSCITSPVSNIRIFICFRTETCTGSSEVPIHEFSAWVYLFIVILWWPRRCTEPLTLITKTIIVVHSLNLIVINMRRFFKRSISFYILNFNANSKIFVRKYIDFASTFKIIFNLPSLNNLELKSKTFGIFSRIIFIFCSNCKVQVFTFS